MKQSLLNARINPGAFFEAAAKEPENLRIPALIVLAGAIVTAAYAYLAIGPISQLMAGAMPSAGSIIILFAVIGSLVVTFGLWVIITILIYLISIAFKGKGTITRTLEFVGYGYIPQIIGSLITLVISLEYIPRVVVPHLSININDPNAGQAIQEATRLLMHDPAMMEFTQITTVISIVFLLWSANIWIFGAKHSRQLAMRDAVICVMVPVLAFVFYTLYTLAVA
jgi:hypothetical protein